MSTSDPQRNVIPNAVHPRIQLPVRGLIDWLDDALSNSPVLETNWVSVGQGEMLAIHIHVSSGRDDPVLRKLYVENSHAFDEAIKVALQREIGLDPATLIAVEPGSIDMYFGINPPNRRRFGLDRIKDAIRKAIDYVIIQTLNAAGRIGNLSIQVTHKVVRFVKDQKPVFDAVLDTWGSLVTPAISAGLRVWLNGLGWGWG